jgi:WD40 repeat protein
MINMWDLRTHQLIQHYNQAHGAGNGIKSIAFGGLAGQRLASTGEDNLVKARFLYICILIVD